MHFIRAQNQIARYAFATRDRSSERALAPPAMRAYHSKIIQMLTVSTRVGDLALLEVKRDLKVFDDLLEGFVARRLVADAHVRRASSELSHLAIACDYMQFHRVNVKHAFLRWWIPPSHVAGK